MEKKVYDKCKDLTVLLVEDYIPLQEKIALFLRDYFKTVETASNGKEGLERYIDCKQNGSSFDIVISDYEMPKMNGIELIKEIKRVNPKQLFIVISAHQNPEYLIEFINLGILHFIPKPIEPHKMLSVFDKVSEMIINTDENILQLSDAHTWHKNTKSLKYKQQHIILSKYDALLFEILLINISLACSVEKILAHFYLHNEDIQKENIRNMVIRLRKKIPDITIKNIYGIGYELDIVEDKDLIKIRS